MISFQQFLALLASCEGNQFESRVDWVTYPSENRYFVPPDLEAEASQGSDSPIILVSAPGAVGKTTFAQAVAHQQNAPVFDLSKRRVGTDAFLGLIGNAFGYECVSNVYQRLKDGTFLLILDALDETKVGSGQANFEGFIEDLATHFQGYRSLPSVVLLARVDTADLIALALELQGVSYQRFGLALFNEASARHFVDRYLDARFDEAGARHLHRIQRSPFEGVRDKLFTLVKAADAEKQGIELLGYSPVLVTLAAKLYEERDYQALGGRLDRFPRDGWNLLADLADDLLTREQADKFLTQLPPELVARIPNALSSDEQCLWLLLEHVGMPTRLSTPSAVPPEVLPQYERAVESQMTEHPFRREHSAFQHPVFRDYVLGWFLSRFSGNRELHDEIRRRLMLKDDLLPTPLLGRFALGLGSRVSGEDLGFLFESFVAQADKDSRAWLVLDSIPGTAEMRGTIGVGDSRVHSAELVVEDNGSGLWFWRHLASAYLFVSCPIELGVQGRELVLGPDVEIACSEFSCPVGQLFVRAPEGEEAVVVEADACREPSQPSLRVDGDFFFVSWPRPFYPWVRHELKGTRVENVEPQVLDAYTHLARILRRLRASGYGEVARHRDIVERFATGGTPTGKAMLQYCLDQGVIVPKGEIFILNDSRAGPFGINWVDLGRREMNDKVRDFLVGFVQESQHNR